MAQNNRLFRLSNLGRWVARLGLLQRGALGRPEHLLAVASWMAYGVLLLARVGAGWQGRRAAWLTVAGFSGVVLVVPRSHVDSAGAVTAAHAGMLADLVLTAQEVARAEGIAESGFRLVFNVGDDALNSVPHLHLHVIGGRKLGWPPG